MASGFICLFVLPDIRNPLASDRLHTHVFWELELMSLKSNDVDGYVLRFILFFSFFLSFFFLPSFLFQRRRIRLSVFFRFTVDF